MSLDVDRVLDALHDSRIPKILTDQWHESRLELSRAADSLEKGIGWIAGRKEHHLRLAIMLADHAVSELGKLELSDTIDYGRAVAEETAKMLGPEGYVAFRKHNEDAARDRAAQVELAANPTCATCRSYLPIHHGPKGTAGDCRRNPPSVAGEWPPVGSYDWCGEHEPKTIERKPTCPPQTTA